MTRFLDREKARILRAEGKSYSDIRKIVDVGKGTLSSWLRDMPLSEEQMRGVRDLNPRRIERFRETVRRKRQMRLDAAYTQAKKDIGRLSRRDLLVFGFALYWAEGTKSHRGRNEVANTDPYIIRACLQWLELLPLKPNIKVRLQLYADMDQQGEVAYWSRILGIPKSQFRKPSIKKSTLSGLSRKSGHGHGTCDLVFDNMPLWEYISMALKYLRESFPPVAQR